MNIDKILKKYTEFYKGRAYSDIATLIRESELSVRDKYSHRTLRRFVSEFIKNNQVVIPEGEWNTNTVAEFNKPIQSRPDTIPWNQERVMEYFRNQNQVYDGDSAIRKADWTISNWITQEEALELGRKYSKSDKITDLVVISDLHGIYLDERCFKVFLKAIKDNPPQELVINGDSIDLPFLSRHSQKLIRAGVLSDYSEIGEIELVKNKILKPLRKALPNTNIVLRLGNHCERITNPYDLTQAQLKRLAIVYTHYQTTKFDEMLDLKSLDIEYDDTPVRNYYGIYDVMHGLSLSKNAQEVNILNRMASGTTGHSHRLGIKYITKANKHYCWAESGHMRTQDEVEYLPTAVLPDWQQGFIRVKFNNSCTSFFVTTHAIINWECTMNNNIYK